MKSILDPSFKYTKAVETDLRKTFAKIRRQQQRDAAERAQKVAVIIAKSKAAA